MRNLTIHATFTVVLAMVAPQLVIAQQNLEQRVENLEHRGAGAKWRGSFSLRCLLCIVGAKHQQKRVAMVLSRSAFQRDYGDCATRQEFR